MMKENKILPMMKENKIEVQSKCKQVKDSIPCKYEGCSKSYKHPRTMQEHYTKHHGEIGKYSKLKPSKARLSMNSRSKRFVALCCNWNIPTKKKDFMNMCIERKCNPLPYGVELPSKQQKALRKIINLWKKQKIQRCPKEKEVIKKEYQTKLLRQEDLFDLALKIKELHPILHEFVDVPEISGDQDQEELEQWKYLKTGDECSYPSDELDGTPPPCRKDVLPPCPYLHPTEYKTPPMHPTPFFLSAVPPLQIQLSNVSNQLTWHDVIGSPIQSEDIGGTKCPSCGEHEISDDCPFRFGTMTTQLL